MLFRALIWRPLRDDWGRTLLSLLAVALGVAVVIALRMANRGAAGSFQRTTQALAGGADLLVSGPEPLPVALLPQLTALNSEAEFLPYLDRHALDPHGQGMLHVVGLDWLTASGAPVGAIPPSAPGAPSVLLAAAHATAQHLQPGDAITLIIGGRPHQFYIAALLPATAPSDLAILDLGDALAAYEPGRPAMFDGLRVQLAPGASAKRVAADLRTRIPAADTVAPPRARLAQDAEMLAAFRANLQALAYVSLLVGVFLIYNTVSISVVRRRLPVATLRALGATRVQIQSLFLGEGALLGLAGGGLGLVFGWLLAASTLELVQRTVNNLYATTAPARAVLMPSDLVWALALALGAAVFAAWSPARAASRALPAQALRSGSAEAEVRSRVRLAAMTGLGLALAAAVAAHLPEPGGSGIGVPWFGFAAALLAVLAAAACTVPGLALVLPRLRRFLLRRGHGNTGMAAGALAGALRRSSVLVAALATALAVTLGVGIMVGSFRQTVNLWIGEQLQGDVFIRAADWDRDHPAALAPEIVAAAAGMPGVVAMEASHSQPWTFRGQRIYLNTRWSLTPEAPRPAYRFLQGGAGPVIVSEPFARRFHLWAGGSFTLASPRHSMQLTIAGVFYDYTSDRGLVVLDPTAFTDGFGAPAPTELGLVAAPGVAPASLGSDLEKHLRDATALSINDNASLRRQALAVFDQTFQITYALELITLIVAILGVGNTLLAVALERAPEFALLRFLGATRAQLGRLLLAESGVVASLALGIGVPLAVVLALILVRVINVQSFGWSIQLHPPYAFLAAAAALTWCAALLAGWLPARAVRRQASPATLEAE